MRRDVDDPDASAIGLDRIALALRGRRGVGHHRSGCRRRPQPDLLVRAGHRRLPCRGGRGSAHPAVAVSGRVVACLALVKEHGLRVTSTGVLTAVFQLLFFVAVVATGVSVTTFVALGFAPVLLLVIAGARESRLPRPSHTLTVAAALLGLVLVSVNGVGDATHSGWGLLAALGSGTAYALAAESGGPLTRTHRRPHRNDVHHDRRGGRPGGWWPGHAAPRAARDEHERALVVADGLPRGRHPGVRLRPVLRRAAQHAQRHSSGGHPEAFRTTRTVPPLSEPAVGRSHVASHVPSTTTMA